MWINITHLRVWYLYLLNVFLLNKQDIHLNVVLITNFIMTYISTLCGIQLLTFFLQLNKNIHLNVDLIMISNHYTLYIHLNADAFLINIS